MKKIVERLRAEAQARPVRFLAVLLVMVIIFAFGMTVGEPIGKTAYYFTH